MSQRTRQLRPEDLAEPREPDVGQLMEPYSCVRTVQVVLMTLLELDSPVPRRRTGEPRMQEVICGISQGLYRRICAGPRENAYVSTLEGIRSLRAHLDQVLHTVVLPGLARLNSEGARLNR